MSYQVLARKWRPKAFTELVGQSHVVRALTNALDNDRLHHAYLFTGTRGVGKTTLARILAKSLNCETGVSSKPCGTCSVCQEIDQGRFADLLEVDAASRTKVDQTRELLDNVPYAPVRGRYKVYLIDEVHMFSDSSFNALLKTLEEPPPHVKFLLATTDPQKVPVTVLSRCLQFSLKRLSVEQITGQFETILAAESLEYEAAALQVLGIAADGSMRDGLSLLDQAIAFSGGKLLEADVKAMLGIVAIDQLPELIRAIDAGDGEAVMALVKLLGEQAPDFVSLLKDLLLLLHRIALLQKVPGAADDSWPVLPALQQLAEQLTAEDVQLYYQIALMGQRDMVLAPDPQSGFEMLLLRMLAFKPAERQSSQQLGEQKKKPDLNLNRQKPVLMAATESRRPIRPAPEQTPVAEVQEKTPEKPVEQAKQVEQVKPTVDIGFCDWHALLPQLELKGLAKQLASHCSLKKWDDKGLILYLDPAGSGLLATKAKEKLITAIASYCGKDIPLTIEEKTPVTETPAQRLQSEREQEQLAAEHEMRNDPVVKMLEEQFSATLQIDSIKILKDN